MRIDVNENRCNCLHAQNILEIIKNGTIIKVRKITELLNYIKYKQSFIASTIHIEKVNNKLLEDSKIITMTHVF